MLLCFCFFVDEMLEGHVMLYIEATLLELTNDEITNDIPKIKTHIRNIERENALARERIDDLLIEEYQAKNRLREQRTSIESAIKMASIPVNFSDIPSADHERFFSRLKNYFNDKHTSIYREKLKTFLSKIK